MTRPLPISLVRVSRSTSVVSAGWLPSADPVEWLREVAHCRAHGCEVVMYSVAHSLMNPAAVGVMLVPKTKGAPPFRARVVPLCEILPGVHAPEDAELPVGLLPNEISYFFPYAVHFFHPSLGVIGFEPKDVISPASLLFAPEQQEKHWNRAMPVLSPFLPLQSISFAIPSDPGEMLEQAGGDIGEKSGTTPDQHKGIGKQIGMVGKGLAAGAVLGVGGVLGMFGAMGGGGKGSADEGALREWAKRNWQQLMDRRRRELDRLMEMMENDPDLGLRYALPLDGAGDASRGKNPAPGWQLGARNTNFRLGGGGGAADQWNVEPDMRLALERKYRDAAQREISLGRYERAAYIYGNLLGDWAAAAQALVKGGRHRDAVSIYLHKLNNKNAAAKCLEDSGLLAQAADLYIECNQFEKAGDLHARLGNEAEARRLWLLEIEAQKNALEKARIYWEKLHDADGALAVLEQSLSSGFASGVTLARMFTILRECQREKEMVDLLHRMFGQGMRMSREEKIALALNESERWGSEPIRRIVEDHSYRIIGEALEENPEREKALLALLPRLAPGDLLLERDAKRFGIAKRKVEVPGRKRSKGARSSGKIIKIPGEGGWQSITALAQGLSVAGHAGGMLMVAQMHEQGCHGSALRTVDDPGGKEIVKHLCVRSSRGESRLFHFANEGRIHYRALNRVRTPEDDALGQLRNILAVGVFGHGTEFLLLEYTKAGSLSVHIYSEAGVRRRTVPVDLAPPQVQGLRWSCAGKGGSMVFAAQGFLAWRFPDGQFSTMALGDQPGEVRFSPIADDPCVLVSHRRAILLVSPTKPGKELETINLEPSSRESAFSVACFAGDGSIVIGHAGGGEVYAPGKYLEPAETFAIHPSAGIPIDACAYGDDGFAFLTDKGNLVVFS